MTDKQVRDAVDQLLHALEQMANDAGRKQLDMHPSRHQQAVDRVMELLTSPQAENAALREIAHAMAKMQAPRTEMDYLFCPFCPAVGDEDIIEHTTRCPVTKARALLKAQAQHDELPTTLDQDATFW